MLGFGQQSLTPSNVLVPHPRLPLSTTIPIDLARGPGAAQTLRRHRAQMKGATARRAKIRVRIHDTHAERWCSPRQPKRPSQHPQFDRRAHNHGTQIPIARVDS